MHHVCNDYTRRYQLFFFRQHAIECFLIVYVYYSYYNNFYDYLWMKSILVKDIMDKA